MKKLNKIFIAVLAVILLSGSLYAYKRVQAKIHRESIERENQKTLEQIKLIQEQSAKENKETLEQVEKQVVTKEAYLEVPFICQAPLETEANWTLHEESCEEAALLQAYLFLKGKTMTKAEANTEILRMIDWQKDNFGGHHDIYADKVKEMAVKFYDIDPAKIRVIKNATIDDIKREISSGHPVIVPITGEILKNPYYPYPGYHMLLVTGYTEDKIITNDNGTRRGKDFSYNIDVFEKAMLDAGAEIVILD